MIFRVACLLVVSFAASTCLADAAFDSVAEIFAQHCIRCHNDNEAKGDFSLTSLDSIVESGMIDPGDASSSIMDIISGPDQSMPLEGDPLSQSDVQTIRDWIAAGAHWPDAVEIQEASKAGKDWWSLQPLAKFENPAELSIDGFIDAKLNQSDLQRNPNADRRTLIRRATYDLIGLPPTPQEIEDFINDPDPNAYEKLIDRLLQSPHYGERWGRHWLDVVRFGESNGFERNVIIEDLWPFRDYVIESLNNDKPFDQFVREHLIGDVIGKGDVNVEVASAFLVAGPYDNVGNKDAEAAAQIRANTIDEMIRATSEAFLGLTVGCARCHNHKFDPISQDDYYKLYATFSGVRHGSRVVATQAEKSQRAEKLKPLQQRKTQLLDQRKEIDGRIQDRINQNAAKHSAAWTRDPVDRTMTEETFDAVQAKFVRFTSEGLDTNPEVTSGFRIDEFEIWTSGDHPTNVALASLGATAIGPSRKIEYFAGAYGPQLAIDGKTGARFISARNHLTIELSRCESIDRINFSSARGEALPDQQKFVFVSDYRIEISDDGKTWTEIANGRNRKPVNDRHKNVRLRKLETTKDDRRQIAENNRAVAEVEAEIKAIPALKKIWVGNRVAKDAVGPFNIFLGGSPQRIGKQIQLASLSVLDDVVPSYELPGDTSEATRRQKLADWIVDDRNALTARVIVNRLWHYHFGTGIVNTPSDFGYMGGPPSHPELLDWLAGRLIDGGWRLKPMHRLIMNSEVYRQTSDFRDRPAKQDADARLLWRFPPRRLSAEEIRDTMLAVSGKLDTSMGGVGFRLYRYLQDNVATYVPLDVHSEETYRRAIYHQNARASVTDLMTDYDQPDCAFSTARRVETTTPLQALTTLNHQFSVDMSRFMAERLVSEAGPQIDDQIRFAFKLCYGRDASEDEVSQCVTFAEEHSLQALCRVLLNTSELIYVR